MSIVKTVMLLGMVATTATVLTGCLDHDTVDGEVIPQIQTLATFDGNNLDGARFSYIPQGDDPMLTLQAEVNVDTVLIHPGNRILLTYQPLQDAGRIKIISAARINGGVLKFEDTDALQGWDADPLFVESLWRTGNYINLRCKILWTPDTRRYSLEADSTTLNTDLPDVYVAHAIADTTDRTNAYMVANYASFDISELWSRPTVRGIKVHVNNSNLPDKTEFTFMK